jgi:DNA-binding response OmpR family regulator
VLLADDDDDVREMMEAILSGKGFEVLAVASVSEALKLISTENFDVLITDLHMPNAGDGFTLVTAMRHSQPQALTLLVSGYPDVQGAMAAILMEADEIIVKPFEAGKLAELLREKMLNHKPTKRSRKESVSMILQRCVVSIVQEWLARAKKSSELNVLALSDAERAGHLPKLLADLAFRLSRGAIGVKDDDAVVSTSAATHGELRHLQGYTPEMLVHESRILQVTIFDTLQQNLGCLDFSLLLPDVMTIADEVDSQLTQSMASYMRLARHPAAA